MYSWIKFQVSKFKSVNWKTYSRKYSIVFYRIWRKSNNHLQYFTSNRTSSQSFVWILNKFVPDPSDQSIGAKSPKNREAKKLLINDILWNKYQLYINIKNVSHFCLIISQDGMRIRRELIHANNQLISVNWYYLHKYWIHQETHYLRKRNNNWSRQIFTVYQTHQYTRTPWNILKHRTS